MAYEEYEDWYENFNELRDVVQNVIEALEDGDINFEEAVEKLKAAAVK